MIARVPARKNVGEYLVLPVKLVYYLENMLSFAYFEPNEKNQLSNQANDLPHFSRFVL